MPPLVTVTFKTLGCKLNQAETAMMMQDFREQGYTVVDSNEGADVTVVNTCTVTGRSDAKCRRAIRHALSKNPETTVIVTGCYSQSASQEIRKIDGVDYILGVDEKLDLFSYFPGPGKQDIPSVAVSPVKDRKEISAHSAGDYGEQTRAVLKIQNGCDNFCTYCIVPLVRGPSRSVASGEVLRQAESLVKRGFKEIVLTGVHVGEYGKKGNLPSRLPQLLDSLADIPGLYRIRLSSLEPENVTPELLDAVSRNPKICRHFHLSIQSGSPEILKAMGRRSDLEKIRSALSMVGRQFPDAGLGADIIVGFPGENEDHFKETRTLLQAYPFSYFHVFPFSKRPGTPAAAMKDVAQKIKLNRAGQLRRLGEEKKNSFRKRWLGRLVEILPENRNDSGWMKGWTSEYLRVEIPFDSSLVNRPVKVRLVNIQGDTVRGCKA